MQSEVADTRSQENRVKIVEIDVKMHKRHLTKIVREFHHNNGSERANEIISHPFNKKVKEGVTFSKNLWQHNLLPKTVQNCISIK